MFYILIIPLVFISLVYARRIPNVTVLVTYSSSGSLAFISDTKVAAIRWREHLNERVHNDPSWPFRANIELMDVVSNFTLADHYFKTRINDKTKPPVTAIIGPESNVMGAIAASYGNRYNIPIMLAITNPDPIKPGRPQIFNTSFLMCPAAVYQFRELVSGYASAGVKSVVAVGTHDPLDTYNTDSCFGAADYADSQGIRVLAKIPLLYTNTTDQIFNLVKDLRDNYKPDAIMWCDWASCALDEFIDSFNPLPMFKQLNYLPKALSFLDCVDAGKMDTMKEDGLYRYVTAPQFVNDKLKGPQFTEEKTPYSSLFRPTHPVLTVTDQMNVGATTESPSSTKLFFEWYKSETGYTASYQTVMTWGAFDILESAMYRAVKNLEADGRQFSVNLAKETLKYLDQAQCVTPLGRVVLDADGVNTPIQSILVQSLDSSPTAEIVFPSNYQTASFIYPMPTWDERYYRWKLLKDNSVSACIGIACVCSVILLAIMITAIVHRKDAEIRMVHYLHIVLMCLAALLIVWSLTFVWQADCNAEQCNLYLWLIYIPASFIVHINNIKAYRLAAFLRASATGKRPKPFTQGKVMRLTLMWVVITVVILGICSGVDHPTLVKEVNDIHRPSLDMYHCETTGTTKVLMYLLVALHILISIVCVVSVRNGMEAFRDGMVIKEAFVILYACLAVAFVLHQLNLDGSETYVLRTAFLGFGVTFFILRLLISRVLPHWVPTFVREKFMAFHIVYIRPYLETVNPVSSASIHSFEDMEKEGKEEEVGPAYAVEVPADDSLKELAAVLKDPRRLNVLTEIAKKSHTVENLDFMQTVLAYEEEAAQLLMQHSSQASNVLREKAQKIYELHVKQSSDEEVNVSSKTRNVFEGKLKEWVLHTPFLTLDTAKAALDKDFYHRKGIFEGCFKEISVMTYQNLWNKFRAAETQLMSLGEA